MYESKLLATTAWTLPFLTDGATRTLSSSALALKPKRSDFRSYMKEVFSIFVQFTLTFSSFLCLYIVLVYLFVSSQA